MNENTDTDTDTERKAIKKFIRMVSEEELVDFILGQQQAIDGLTKNNESFRKYIKQKTKRSEKLFSNTNYLKVASLLSEWMNEQSDYDDKIWSKLKKD